MLRDGGRIIAMTYAPGGRFGSWQPWVAMGAAKAALEVLCRYFAVALASRQITVNAISPGWTEDSVLNTLPEAVQNAIRIWHQSGWTPMRKLGMPTSEMPSRYFARRKPTGSLGKSWTWMEAPRSWMRTSLWKSSNCPPQEAPTPPSPFFAEVLHSKSSNGMSPSLGPTMLAVTDDSRHFPF